MGDVEPKYIEKKVMSNSGVLTPEQFKIKNIKILDPKKGGKDKKLQIGIINSLNNCPLIVESPVLFFPFGKSEYNGSHSITFTNRGPNGDHSKNSEFFETLDKFDEMI